MSLVELALARPREERHSYIESACGEDTELIGEVRKYVSREERMDGFLLDPLYAAPNVEQPFEPGEVLAGRFRIVREVDEGGMGIVYEAIDEKLERRIAIKCAKSGFRKRLPPEVRHASEIAHPNICKIHEIHSAYTSRGEIDFLTMEFLEGETLAQRLQRGRLKEEQARAIARQLCAGLAEAHRHQVVHGDLKSNNVILARDADGTERAVITDFGLARGPAANAARGRAQSLEAGGSPDYMAPELWKGEKASPASDVYALGVILCELAVGRRPFGPEVPLEERLRRKPPAIHPKWDRVLSRCLDPDPSRRFSNALEVAKALDPVRPRWWLTAAAVAALAIAVAGVAFERATTPKETLRLAMLPIEPLSADLASLASDLSSKTAGQLARLKGGSLTRLTFIPPEKARAASDATHVLHATLTKKDGRLFVHTNLMNASSRVNARDWTAAYDPGQERYAPVALAGMVTATLNLPPLAINSSVNSAAHDDYQAAIQCLRRDSGADAALFHLQRAVVADQDSPLVYAALVEARRSKYYSSRNQIWWDACREAEREAEIRNPDLPAVHRIEGLLLADEGLYNLAEAEYRRAISLEPRNSDGHRRLAIAYEAEKQFDPALAEYRQAIALEPDYYKPYQSLASFYYNRANFSDAEKLVKQAIQLAQDEPGPRDALAAYYMLSGKFAETKNELEVSIRLKPTQQSVFRLGLTQMYLNDDGGAIASFLRALTLDSPGGVPKCSPYMYLGIAYRRSNMQELARKANEKGLELALEDVGRNLGDGRRQIFVGYFDAALGNPRAKSEIDAAVQAAHEDSEARWTAVLAYEVLHLRQETLKLVSTSTAQQLADISRWPDLVALKDDPHFQNLIASRQVN
jgi:Flp pilus assembly protein TadD